MAIPEDRQQAALREAQETITQTRAAVQAAAQRLTQAQATLAGMTAQYTPFIADAASTPRLKDEWAGTVAAFGALRPLVDVAVARPEVAALKSLEV